MKDAAEYKRSVYLIIILCLTGFIIPEELYTKENPVLSIEIARKEYLKGHYDRAMDVLMETDVKTVDKNIKSLIYLEMAYVKYLMGYRGFSCKFYLKKAISYKSEPEGIGLYEKGFLKILEDVQNQYTPEDRQVESITEKQPKEKAVKLTTRIAKKTKQLKPETGSYEKDFDIRVFEKHYDNKLTEIHKLKSSIASLNSRIRHLKNQKNKSLKNTSTLKTEHIELKKKSLKAEEQVTVLTLQIEQMKRDQEVLVERIVAAKLKKFQEEMKEKADSGIKEDVAKRNSALNSLEVLHEIWKRGHPLPQKKITSVKGETSK